MLVALLPLALDRHPTYQLRLLLSRIAYLRLGHAGRSLAPLCTRRFPPQLAPASKRHQPLALLRYVINLFLRCCSAS